MIALKKEIESLRREISKIEDKILDLEEEKDDLYSSLREAEKKLSFDSEYAWMMSKTNTSIVQYSAVNIQSLLNWIS